MNTPLDIDDPAHWRRRAEEALRMAELIEDAEAKQTMIDIAKAYEEMALIIEAREASGLS